MHMYGARVLVRYMAIWRQMATRGGILSAVNGFQRHHDSGYGPRAGDVGILDPVDALRKPYGFRAVVCNVAHMPTVRDVNAPAQAREEEAAAAAAAAGRTSNSTREPASTPTTTAAGVAAAALPVDGNVLADDDDGDLDPTGELRVAAAVAVHHAVDSMVTTNGGARVLSVQDVRHLAESLKMPWSERLRAWAVANAVTGKLKKIRDDLVKQHLSMELHQLRANLRRASVRHAAARAKARILPLDESAEELYWAALLPHPYTQAAWSEVRDINGVAIDPLVDQCMNQLIVASIIHVVLLQTACAGCCTLSSHPAPPLLLSFRPSRKRP
jgi:hypothetical protein